MKSELQNYIARPKRYDNIDGTGEMVVGLALLGFALAGYLEALLPGHSPTWIRVVVIYASLMLALAFAFGARRAIKRYITWPRTGYAAYPRGSRRWWIMTVTVRLIVILAAVGLAFLAKRYHAMLVGSLSPKTWNLRVIMLIVISIVVYAIGAARMGKEHRWKWLVLVSMILCLFTFGIMIPEDFGQWDRPPVLLVAMLWLGSAAGTLYSYLRRTKSAGPELE